MESKYFINSLKKSVNKIKTMLEDVSDEQARWKPAPEKWSILEVVNHLYDEERDDFRKRLDLTLHSPDEDWPGIDPEKWSIEREYNKRDYPDSLNNFFAERKKSMEWLRALVDPDWDRIHQHPVIGALSAADLLAAWVAHDYLHLRQLANLYAGYLNIMANPHSTRYASP
jgi:uncharacterized damage-inducible protein DinB